MVSTHSGEPRFLADSMVGKLAQWLRLLGYDAAYEPAMDDALLVDRAGEEGRILLTRDRRLVERRACRRYVLVVSDDPLEQLAEVVSELGLEPEPVCGSSRCLRCNRRLESVAREGLAGAVPPYVLANHRRFARCPACHRVYWRGTHFAGMRDRLERALGPESGGSAAGTSAPRGRATIATGLILLAVATVATLVSLGASRLGSEDGPAGRGSAYQRQYSEEWLAEQRSELVALLRAQGISSEAVLDAIGTVPRHRFVPEAYRAFSYRNAPLAIGFEQTISQPYIVAIMTQLLELEPDTKVLEIGTGSGYQAAVLAELECRVFTIEIIPELAEQAGTRLAALGYDNVTLRAGDGYLGWPEEAPFDRIIVTAAPEEIPQALVEQLKPGGRLVVPVGPQYRIQQLVLLAKEADGTLRQQAILPVRFVPMVRKKK